MASRGKILLFFDDDDVADFHLLEEHIKAHERHPQENVAVLGYTTWAPTLSITPLMRYVTESGCFLFAYGDLRDGQMLDFTYFWGGRSSCKRSFLAKRGIFNRRFRFGSEDVELAYRLSKFGFRVVFHRAAVSYMTRPPTLEEFCDRCERQGESLFLFSRLHDDPIVQQYCKLADPFIDNRAVGVDAEAKWPDVAALFREKVDQLGRVERLLAWGFEPKAIPEAAGSKQLAQAEAYRLQMHELFAKSAQAEAYRLQMRDLFAKITELEAKLSQREAAYHAEMAQREAAYHAEMAQREAVYQGEDARLQQEMAQREAVYQAELARVNKDMAQREAVYQAELARVNKDMAQREAVYQAELARVNKDMAQREAVYQAELARVNKDMAELARLNDEFKNRFEDMTHLLHDKSVSLAEQEQRVIELTDRLRKQLWSTRKLSRLLDDTEKAAARLRSSRRWKLANPMTAIEAKLFSGKGPMGYGHLEKIVDAYTQWRALHPEIGKIKEEISALQNATISKYGAVDLGKTAQESQIVEPPVPVLPVESISFPTHEDVAVSIIVPVFNQFQYTHACLASLQTVGDKVAFEVIVVDDCSTDETTALVQRMEGVIYLRNETNSGFIASCNRGANKARGKYLFFLNNDTLVKEGWLTTLVDTFAEEPGAGIIGSKLVFPDGRLQEAGGIIWRDASGWNYGKFDDPKKPEYNYLRDVDYCSAAALMVPRSLFQKIGGFDERYAPAYYEDTDLAFKVRSAGYRVLYQPLSQIIHYEGATGGTDLSAGTKKYQDINRSTFAARWASDLLTRPVTGDLAFLRQPSPGRKSILVIDHHLAYVRLYAPQSRVIFDTVDLHFLREDREARLTRDPEARQKAQDKQRLEHELIDEADETWVVSSVEQQLLQQKRPDKSIQIVSNIVDIPGSNTPFALRRDWLFIGGFQHTPNIDAVTFFLNEIYPLVRHRLPGAKFYIIGDKAPPEVVAMANENVIVTGLQTDVRPFFESARLSVAPLRFGAGVKGKINQSMAFGVPVVATSLAVEGMDLTDHEDVLVADQPEDFARAVIELYESEELWSRLSRNSIAKTRALYSVEAARERLSFLLSEEQVNTARKVRMPAYKVELTSDASPPSP